MSNLRNFAAALFFATQANSKMEAFSITSDVVLPILRQAADSNGVELVNPWPSDPMITGTVWEVEPDGRYRTEAIILFRTTAVTWEDACVWLRKTVESIPDDKVRLLSISQANFS